ncbi:MAG: pyridoxal phosphate-dependent aminotransferase [Rhizobiaceae bacterium]
MPDISKRLLGIVPEGENDGWEVHFAAFERKMAGEDILMLSIGDHEFDTPEATVEACVRAVRGGHHHYSEIAGMPALRAAIAKMTEESTGVETSPAQVLATIGGQAALNSALLGTLDHGDHGIMISPYYVTYPGGFNFTGASHTVVDASAENGFQPDPEDIRAAVRSNTKSLLINSPNNPTGAVYSRETLEEIADICREHDLWLISDEVYSTHTGPEHPHISPRALEGMKQRTLVINSLSKSHGMTGWRVGWLIAPERFVQSGRNLNLISTYGLNDFVSRAATEAIENAYGVDEITHIYAKRQAKFVELMRGINSVTVRGSEGGMYVMLDIRGVAATGQEFAWALLNAEKVAVLPGESFGSAATGHVRISMCQTDELLEEAAYRLKRFVTSQNSN